ncbi:hypothetical protein BIFGAL_03406 [Bifidobacterium gallicum DSM 20093 = LMG 11596]|uniref:Uncharacterized protein n=1 Tax=Bifidobacterium gallicum DSM 20093 = LMG 11596 TaxID=561180 RepID=D1NU85_9BIFI|nr:hypothetical protein BIFGAL_03406 [Bifidobacterium gallicum DSM 20093 = LMG 11596]
MSHAHYAFDNLQSGLRTGHAVFRRFSRCSLCRLGWCRLA